MYTVAESEPEERLHTPSSIEEKGVEIQRLKRWRVSPLCP
jgi:hypothetical protein